MRLADGGVVDRRPQSNDLQMRLLRQSNFGDRSMKAALAIGAGIAFAANAYDLFATAFALSLGGRETNAFAIAFSGPAGLIVALLLYKVVGFALIAAFYFATRKFAWGPSATVVLLGLYALSTVQADITTTQTIAEFARYRSVW